MIALGATCGIRGTELTGVVVGARRYVGDQDRYSVRYMAHGVPYEREFTAGELSFAGSNVVALRAHIKEVA